MQHIHCHYETCHVTLRKSYLTCLKWDTMLYQQGMLISSGYFSNLPHLLISKLCSLIELLILILNQNICRFLTNRELEL